jgi:hypothetical protein
MLQDTLTKNTTARLVEDLRRLNVTLDSWGIDAITGILSVALTTAYQEGFRDALLRVTSELNKHKRELLEARLLPKKDPLPPKDLM